MAKRVAKKSEVPRDNVASVTIGEIELELEASLGASITYGNAFRGRLEAPYKGILSDDMLQVWNASKQTVDGVDEDGNATELPNPDYRGIDVEALLRLAWAMAVAANSPNVVSTIYGDDKPMYRLAMGYDEFYEQVIHQPAGVFEEAALFGVVVMQLGGGIIFRRPEGRDGAVEADEAQEGQEG